MYQAGKLSAGEHENCRVSTKNEGKCNVQEREREQSGGETGALLLGKWQEKQIKYPFFFLPSAVKTPRISPAVFQAAINITKTIVAYCVEEGGKVKMRFYFISFVFFNGNPPWFCVLRVGGLYLTSAQLTTVSFSDRSELQGH